MYLYLLPNTCTLTAADQFYDPSSEDSNQAGHSLSFTIWSESSLYAWKNLRSLPTHREISRSFSAKSCGISPRNVEEFLGEISDFYFSPRKKIFRARGVPRRKKSFFLGLICMYRHTRDSKKTWTIWIACKLFGAIWKQIANNYDTLMLGKWCLCLYSMVFIYKLEYMYS